MLVSLMTYIFSGAVIFIKPRLFFNTTRAASTNINLDFVRGISDA